LAAQGQPKTASNRHIFSLYINILLAFRKGRRKPPQKQIAVRAHAPRRRARYPVRAPSFAGARGWMMPLDNLLSAFVTLFLVVDPLGIAPAFLAVTEGLPAPARRQVAARASLIAAVVLAGAALGGEWLLRMLGITLPAFRIAGGLLLFSIASEMAFGLRIQRQSKAAEQALEEHVRNIAAFPLAIPLMAGPGAITATVLLAGRASGDLRALALLIGVIVAVVAICYAVFGAAGQIAKLIGVTGNLVLSRLLGVLLAALAVQYVIDGIRALLAQ
jgi:multiple antibiotic resistance protein